MSAMDEKEDGEISLEDVSSSDEGQSTYEVPRSVRMPSPARRSHAFGYGKENRHYTGGINSRYVPNPASRHDGLLPISSEDEREIVENPETSHQLCIHIGKKKRKRKKKKAPGEGGLLMEDFVSSTDREPLVLNAPAIPTEITVHRRRRSPSPRGVRRHSPFTRARCASHSPSPPQRVYGLFRRSPSPRRNYSRSPSPRRRSPRRVRLPREESPRECPAISSRSKSSPVSRTKSRRRTHCRRTPTYAEVYAATLLKKVRRLETVGAITNGHKHKDHSSLKDKLNNMITRRQTEDKTETNGSDTNELKKESKSEGSESESEEGNLEVLRRLALETKQQKSEADHQSEDDPEALELRMIALKSAVMKKHLKRVKNGNKRKNNPRESSPFVDSFLQDLVNSSSSPERSPDDQQVDMELDTDVEREKEDFSPYSPTDEIMRDSPGPDRQQNVSGPGLDARGIPVKNEEERDSGDALNMEAPYSPTDPTKTPWVDRFKKERRKNILTTITINTDSESSEAAPYSPSDIPMYDPEFPICPPDTLEPQDDDHCVALDLSMKDPSKTVGEAPTVEETSEKSSIVSPQLPGDAPGVDPGTAPLEVPQPQDVESEKKKRECPPLTSGPQDDLSKRAAEVIGEPLYLRGLPEVTKEPNKIPILVNKSLLPVSILKTNKNLQQPLPQKRTETPSEPVFRNAEMQPVAVTEQVVNPFFKPIKLQPVVKKSTVVASAAAFSNVSMDNSNAEASEHVSNGILSKDDEEERKDHENPSDEGGEALKKKKKRTGMKLKAERIQEKRKRVVKAQAMKESLSSNSEAPGDGTNPEVISSENARCSEREESIPKRCESNGRGKENEANASVIEFSRESSPRECDNEQKKNEENVQTTGNDGNDKKRRNSIEEDEETLRAILLASLAKRPKTGEGVGRGSDEGLKGSEGAPKVQKRCELIEKTRSSITESKPMSEAPPANPEPSRTIATQNSTLGAVLKPLGITRLDHELQRNVMLTVEGRKRLNPSVIRGPPKKILRKAAIPVSTKVVNNAKRIQNSMMQKKMILQAQGKVGNSSGNLNTQNLKLVNLKGKEARPVSPKMKGKVQSLVIKLGEDSESESGEERGQVPPRVQRDVLTIPTTDFETSVEQFLKEQRKKQETMARCSVNATSTPANTPKIVKTVGFSGTPLAVRHLPPSQQEEYKRLKQKILEKERQRATRQIINTPPSPLSPASPISKPAIKSVTPKLPSALSKPSEASTPKTPSKAPIIPKLTTAKKINDKSCKKSSQSLSPKICVTDQLINNCSSSTPMTNLSIQIPNDNVTAGGRIVFDKPENSEGNSPKGPSALRILTTDQLNSKFVQVQLRKEGRTVTLGEGADKSIGELLQCSDFEINDTNDNESRKGEEATKELSLGEIEKSSDQTTQESGDGGSLAVDSEASTVILPPREDEEGEVTRESGDSTIVLDDTVVERPEAPKSPLKSKSKSPTKEQSDKIKSDVKAELEGLASLNDEQQKEKLKEFEKNLVTKRYSVLDDLAEMSSTLKQLDLERELQTNLSAELRRLRAQVAVAEERLMEQRLKIDSIGPKVTNAHKMIRDGRTECFKLTKLCQGIGTKVVGQQYKVPSTGAQLMMDSLKEVAYRTRQLSKKKVPCENNNNNETESASGQSINSRTLCTDTGSCNQRNGNGDNVNSEAEQCDNATGVVISRSTEESQGEAMILSDSTVEIPRVNPGLSSAGGTSPDESTERLSHLASSYESVLTSIRTPRHIDCNRELCPFELTGVCKDDECLYNHLEPRSQR
ncbi:uncharacterized protein [Fopius arisanus]|uniref:Uncharacterized protein isoform X2 n=1 Tax=Fopius arisanus TaxID=64838 RepID=A0A9R1U076_9HYME|nr:PREDICTED: uncharacterized protein LOC105266132 isoform X2 [Fopius arisanus]